MIVTSWRSVSSGRPATVCDTAVCTAARHPVKSAPPQTSQTHTNGNNIPAQRIATSDFGIAARVRSNYFGFNRQEMPKSACHFMSRFDNCWQTLLTPPFRR
jgi:hypothetical protein